MNLETKRNALMNAVASGQITNLLANTTWQNGFYNNSGGIGSQSPNNIEKYETEYIDLDINSSYVISVLTSNNNSNWIGVATYNNDGTFKARKTVGEGSLGMVLSNESKVRVSYRTFNNSYILMCTLTEWENFMASNGIYVGE